MRYAILRVFVVAAAVLPAIAGAGVKLSQGAVSLMQDPLVMRLSKDEFRIAFGLQSERCAPRGCRGIIRYRVQWRADDGTARSEVKQVSYKVLPQSSRTLTVDRQYFDTAEGAHTTEVLGIRVDSITCLAGSDSAAAHGTAAIRS